MQAIMTKKHLYTSDYPLRYVAHQNHDVIVESEKTKNDFTHKGGEELLYFHKQYGQGYITVGINSYQGKSFLVKLEALYPDHLCKMKLQEFSAETYAQAKEKAFQYIEEAERWIVSDWWKDIPSTIATMDVWEALPEHFKMVAHDGTKVVRLVGDGRKWDFNVNIFDEKNKNNEYYKVEIARECHTMRYNEREYFDQLMRQEGKTVEVLEKMGMKFANYNIYIKLFKMKNGTWIYRIYDPMCEINRPDQLPVNAKEIYWKWSKELMAC